MPKYTLPVTWQMISDVDVVADSLEDAISKLEEKVVNQEDLPKGKYVKHSFEVQHDFIEE